MLRTKRVEAGDWRTLEWFFNAKGTAFFKAPAGAKIKMRYGVGWLGKDGQKKTLDGHNKKKLSTGLGSVFRARMQMRVERTVDVTYDVYPGEIVLKSKFEF